MVASDEPLLVVEHASYAYLERFPALDDVSLSVRRGEKVALVGANGCGKSTMLKLLAGLVFPDAGRYTAFGSLVTEDNLEDAQFSEGFRARVGFVFQNSDAQVFSPTVRDEIAFGPLNMGLDRADAAARVDDTLGMLDIIDLAERAPYQLSGGQKKRVAIASVLVMNPEVLLFDEPTAALDPRAQQWLIELIVELNESGKTIVLATHDLETLDLLADQCIVFSEKHHIAGVGPPDQVLDDDHLLRSVNLIHDHSHSHSGTEHSHPHGLDHHHNGHADHKFARLSWSVPDVTCDACERTIEAAIRPLTGIDSIVVNVAEKRVDIRYQTERAYPDQIRHAIEASGYRVEG